MTPAEFKRRLQFVLEERNRELNKEQKKQDAALYRAAWICATISNFAGKKSKRWLSPEDLLKKASEKQTPEMIEQKRRYLIERHNLHKHGIS